MPSTFNFLFFGCWNRDDCNADYRKAVLDKVTQILDNREIPVDFAVVAGDNWYPRKGEDGVKRYYKDTLVRGFNMLTSLTQRVHTYAIMGNHNVASNSVYDAEMSYSSEHLDLHRMYRSVLQNGIKLHFVDTTLLDKNVSDESLTVFLHSLVEGLEQHKDGWNIIIAHHPLVLLKKKPKPLYEFEQVLDKLQTVANPRILYMCADVHNFHAMDIIKNGFKLPTIVCGTGGASPDDVNIYQVGQIVKVEPDVQVVPHVFAKPFGFCSVEVQPNEIRIVYHQIVREDGIQECSRPQVKITYDGMKLLPMEISHGEDQVCSLVQPIPNCQFTDVEYST